MAPTYRQSPNHPQRDSPASLAPRPRPRRRYGYGGSYFGATGAVGITLNSQIACSNLLGCTPAVGYSDGGMQAGMAFCILAFLVSGVMTAVIVVAALAAHKAAARAPVPCACFGNDRVAFALAVTAFSLGMLGAIIPGARIGALLGTGSASLLEVLAGPVRH